MRWIVIFGLLFYWAHLVQAASPGLIIQGSKVTVQGGRLDVNKEVFAVIPSTSTTGQCMGILCGVTYPF